MTMDIASMDSLDIMRTGFAVAVLALVAGWWFVVRPTARRRATKFTSLAQAYRCAVESKGEFERLFTMNVHNRDFKVSECYSSGRGAGNVASMGVSGYFLVTSTPLKSEAWQLHVVEIRKGEWRRPVASNMTQKRTGDEAFDREFAVSELGDTLPAHWLDKEARGLVRLFFALPMEPTALNVEAGVLTHHVPYRGDEMTPRALEEMLRRLGWLAGALDRAAAGRAVATIDPISSAESADELDAENSAGETANPVVDRGPQYTLTKNTLSIGGDYTITDESGATMYSVSGKLRIFFVAFSLRDAQKNVLLSGRERAWNLDQKFEISRNDMLFATMQREMVSGHRKILGTPIYRYVIALATGDKMEATAAHGTFSGHWKLRWHDETVADVSTDGEVSKISFARDARDVPFFLTVVMAIVRLNPPSRSGSSTN